MENKNYANFVRHIFGPGILNEDQELNQNQELAHTVDQILEDAWAPRALEHIAIDVILEGKEKEDLAAYIREHADELATRYSALALRYLKHPRQSKQLRPYIKFADD